MVLAAYRVALLAALGFLMYDITTTQGIQRDRMHHSWLLPLAVGISCLASLLSVTGNMLIRVWKCELEGRRWSRNLMLHF